MTNQLTDPDVTIEGRRAGPTGVRAVPGRLSEVIGGDHIEASLASALSLGPRSPWDAQLPETVTAKQHRAALAPWLMVSRADEVPALPPGLRASLRRASHDQTARWFDQLGLPCRLHNALLRTAGGYDELRDALFDMTVGQLAATPRVGPAITVQFLAAIDDVTTLPHERAASDGSDVELAGADVILAAAAAAPAYMTLGVPLLPSNLSAWRSDEAMPPVLCRALGGAPGSTWAGTYAQPPGRPSSQLPLQNSAHSLIPPRARGELAFAPGVVQLARLATADMFHAWLGRLPLRKGTPGRLGRSRAFDTVQDLMANAVFEDLTSVHSCGATTILDALVVTELGIRPAVLPGTGRPGPRGVIDLPGAAEPGAELRIDLTAATHDLLSVG